MTYFTHSSGKHIQVGDAEIYFEVTGNLQGNPLILLHGGMGNLTDFNCIVDKLPADFKLIAIDLRGHGKSTLGKSALTYQQHQTDVEAVLESLGIDYFSVLGFSDGGVTALRLAAKMPSKVQCLVNVAGHHMMDPNTLGFNIIRGITAEGWKDKFPDSVSYYLANNPDQDFTNLVKAVVSLWTNLEESAYPDTAVRQIANPTLLVRGDNDPFFSLQDIIALQTLVVGATFFNIPYAGHEAYKDDPLLFSQVVSRFLVDNMKTKS